MDGFFSFEIIVNSFDSIIEASETVALISFTTFFLSL
jgi:hypothetical protein